MIFFRKRRELEQKREEKRKREKILEYYQDYMEEYADELAFYGTMKEMEQDWKMLEDD